MTIKVMKVPFRVKYHHYFFILMIMIGYLMEEINALFIKSLVLTSYSVIILMLALTYFVLKCIDE